MENKQFLKSFLKRIEQEYQIDASVYGTKTNELNSVYAIIFINDDYLGFGYQENGTDNSLVKQIELEKITKVSFQGSTFMIQVKNEVFNFSIHTSEEALRAMCKEFKMKKTVDELKEGGDLMSSSVGQTKKTIENRYSPMERVTPFGMVKEYEPSLVDEHQEMPKQFEEGYITPESNVEQPEEVGHTKMFSVQEVEDALIGNHKVESSMQNLEHTIVTPAVYEEVVQSTEPVVEKKTNNELFAEMLGTNSGNQLTEEEQEQFAKEDTSKIRIGLITDEPSLKKKEEVVPEKPKTLSKKELKAIEKQRKREEKLELDQYKESHPIRNTILVIVGCSLFYILGSYALAKSFNIVLPLSDLFETLLDYSAILVSSMTK